ncbi:hypothetical protein D3C78_1620990 [compost metagenome]
MILLGRYGFNSEVYTGWDYIKWVGLIRNGNMVRAGRGRNVTSWTDQYRIETRRLTNLTVPLIESMY